MKRLQILGISIMTLSLLSVFVFSNISNSATYISDAQKQIIRDTKRLNDLTIFRKAIEDYKAKNGYYPKLETGTNIKGYVNSSWASQWSSFCSSIGLSSCPSDPVNVIYGCDCNTFGSCTGDNVNSNINTATCYNSKNQKASCTIGSHIYQYKVLNNGRNYSLMMDFEYKKSDDVGAGTDYWNVNNNDNGNYVTIDNNCTGAILSNSLPKCGDKIIQPGEQCDGNDKIELCTNTKNEFGKIAIRCVNCQYETKETRLTDECKTSNFCGDGIVDFGANEECDGGYQKMCFNSTNSMLGQHDWYKEQLRYCQANCKWDKTDSYRDSLTLDICGGYCGDGIVNGSEDCDFGVEYSFWDDSVGAFKKCTDYNSEANCPSTKCNWTNNACRKKNSGDTIKESHCFVRSGASCMYINNSPVMPAVKNTNFSALSYIKSGENYIEEVSSINENTLAINKTSRNSVYFEFSLDGVAINSNNISDIDGDEIMYKFEFINKANDLIGFYKVNNIIGSDSILSKTRGEEITGKWLKHTDLAKIDPKTGKYTSRVYFRVYSTALSSDTDEARAGILHLLDGLYFGDYKFRISIKDSWASGPNVNGNKQGEVSSKDISFYIGTSCGDHVLQAINDDGQHEYCEWKPGYSKFTNWSVNEPDNNSLNNCGNIKFKIYNSDNVTFWDWNGKWDNENCSWSYYGLCKKETDSYCPDGFISVSSGTGNLKTCYGLTSAKGSYDAVNTECYFDHEQSLLADISGPAENNLIRSFVSNVGYNTFTFGYNGTSRTISDSNPILWMGYYNVKKLRTTEQNNQFPSDTDPLSLWLPISENGRPNIYANAVYNGGTGKNFSSQYLCSDTCVDVGGYCGDGILENGTQSALNSSFFTVRTNSDKTTVRTYYLSNFEQCDPTSQNKSADFAGQTGLGTGWYLQSDGTKVGDNYGCQACSLVGGYCGSGSINNSHFTIDGYQNISAELNMPGLDYEHCDPKYVLRPKDSGKNTQDRGVKPNYICSSSGDIISSSDAKSNLFKIPDPKSEARVTWIPYSGLPTSNPGANIKYNDSFATGSAIALGNFNNPNSFLADPSKAKSFSPNTNGACMVSSGGYCGDGKIQMSYIGYLLTQDQEELYSTNPYYQNSYPSGLLYNDREISLGKVLLNRKIVVGTSNYRNYSQLDSNGNIVGTVSNITEGNSATTYNYGINNNNTLTGDVICSNYSSQVDCLKNASDGCNWTGSKCYSQFNNTNADSKIYWLEKCDPKYFPTPFETNDLVGGSFYKKVDSNLNYLTNKDFSGIPTLRYICNDVNANDYACDFQTYHLYGRDKTENSNTAEPIVTDVGLRGSDYNIGYCGDGLVTTYGDNNFKTNTSANTNAAKNEGCDPKNYIVGPNGSDANFGNDTINGCRRNTYFSVGFSDFVYGKDCSTYVTPATSSASNAYSCNYNCTDADKNQGGGYCGDGTIQSNFFEQCDPGNVAGNVYNNSNTTLDALGVINAFSSANVSQNYICGVQSGYESNYFDKEFQNNDDLKVNFNSKTFKSDNVSKNGKVASCQTFGGYCGDGAVQACVSGNSFYGGDKNYNKCYNLSSYGTTEPNGYQPYSFAGASGATLMEGCDSTDSACFVVSGSTAVKPALMFDNADAFDFKTGVASTMVAYSELVGYSGGSGSINVSNGINGVCGSDNATNNNVTTANLKNLCSIGVATNPTFNTATKRFEWKCNGLKGGITASCFADTNLNTGSAGACGSNDEYVCDKPSCTNGSSIVSEGEQCTAGADCVTKKIGTNDMQICTVSCKYKNKAVGSGEVCDSGVTCSKINGRNIKQRFSSFDMLDNKCSGGFAEDVIVSGGVWSWTCKGIGSGFGTNKSCSAATSFAVDGVCGSGFGACNRGVASKPQYDSYSNRWTWTCGGFNGGEADNCSSGPRGGETSSPACGSVNGGTFLSLHSLTYTGNTYTPERLCSGGYVTSLDVSGSKYVWKCTKASTSVNCEANIDTNSSHAIDGSCPSTAIVEVGSSSEVSCATGYVDNISYIPAFNQVKWDCNGEGIGASIPVKNVKCYTNLKSFPIDARCDSPFTMFSSSSGVQTPTYSQELKKASSDGKMFQGMSFKLCKSGYPINLTTSGETSWATGISNAIPGNVTKGNYCTSGSDAARQSYANGSTYLSADCFNLKIHVPIVGDIQILRMTMPWQWTCKGVAGGSDENCMVFNSSMFIKKNGACGDDARQICTQSQCGSSHLASKGQCSSNSKTCSSDGDCGGAPGSCVKNDINLTCPVANNGGSMSGCVDKKFAESAYITDRCESGYSANVTVNNNTVTWKCLGFNGGSDATCSADIIFTPLTNGLCGSSDGNTGIWNYSGVSSPCDRGIYSGLTLKKVKDGNNNDVVQWSWLCEGVSGGSTDECFSGYIKNVSTNTNITSLDGKCSNITGPYKSTTEIMNAGACTTGNINNITYDMYSNIFTWGCTGIGGGKTDNCSATASF